MKTSREEIYRMIKKIGNSPGKFIDIDLAKDHDGPLVNNLINEGFLSKEAIKGLGTDIEFIPKWCRRTTL